jgi:hypothetical protein
VRETRLRSAWKQWELVMSPQIFAITVFDVVWVLAAYAVVGLSALTLFNALPS